MHQIVTAMLEQADADGWTDGSVAWVEGGLFALVQGAQITAAVAEAARRQMAAARHDREGWRHVGSQAAERLRP